MKFAITFKLIIDPADYGEASTEASARAIADALTEGEADWPTDYDQEVKQIDE